MAADDDGEQSAAPWHHSTSNVVGASVAALAVIALVVWGVSALGGADQPQDAPTSFVNPTYSSTTTSVQSSTSTITPTQTPVTSEIIGPPDASTSDTTSTTSPSESTTTTSTWTSHELPTTRRHEPESGDGSSTSRSRPRQNVTRTLYPGPGA